MFNPAFSGLNERMYGYLTYARNDINQPNVNEWTFKAGQDLNSKKLHGAIGFNLNIWNNNWSWVTKMNSINLNYNYQFHLGDQRVLSIGISPGYVETLDNSDYGYSLTGSGSASQIHRFFVIGSGLAYSDGRLATGVSVNNINQPSFSGVTQSSNGIDIIQPYEFRLSRNYNFQLQYTFFKDRRFDLVPALVLNKYGSYDQGALNITCHGFNKLLWVGATWVANFSQGSTQSYSGLLGVTIRKKWNVGGSLDIYRYFSGGDYKLGGYQIVLSYALL